VDKQVPLRTLAANVAVFRDSNIDPRQSPLIAWRAILPAAQDCKELTRHQFAIGRSRVIEKTLFGDAIAAPRLKGYLFAPPRHAGLIGKVEHPMDGHPVAINEERARWVRMHSNSARRMSLDARSRIVLACDHAANCQS
jgi:hypothetical protein